MNSRTPLHPTRRLLLLLLVICPFLTGPLRAEDEIEKAFRDALYAEEVKGDAEAALKAYQEVSARFEPQRDMAATALFRQGECLRKLGRKDEAAAIYKRVLAQYGDKERAARLSRENLAALGQPATDAVPPAAVPADMTEDEAKELVRLKVMAANSPDLLNQGSPTPLHLAVESGHTTVVAWLLDKLPKEDPHRFGAELQRACYLGHLKICELLVNAGADLNGWGALHSAVEQNRPAVVRLLLDRKADPNGTGSLSLSNVSWPLWRADFKSPVSVGQEYVRDGTALMAAATSDKLPPDILAALLNAGAQVNEAGQVVQRNGDGNKGYPVTVLGLAIAARNPEKVRLLLAAKADPNLICNDLEATPLLVALALRATSDEHSPKDDAADGSIIEQLIAAGANWKQQLTTGVTALHIAAKNGTGRWVEGALKAGLDVNATDRKGYTALHFAAWEGSPDAVRALLAAKAKFNVLAKDNDRQFTPLFTACYGGKETPARIETLRLLLDAGADPNLGTPAAGRPLSLALPGFFVPQSIRAESARLLIEKGAKPAGTNALQVWNRPKNWTVPSEETLALFRIVWKAAHWRDNPRLSHAVWFSQSESPVKAVEAPTFKAILCDEAAAGPPTLRQFIALADHTANWSNVTIIRQGGKNEAIPVDVLALAGEAEKKDVPLQWGDVVEVPAATAPEALETRMKLIPWVNEGASLDVRIEVGDKRVISNSRADAAPLLHLNVDGPGRWGAEGTGLWIYLEDVLRHAGVPRILADESIQIRRTAADGSLALISATGVRHGDIVVVKEPASQANLSDEAQRSGIWLCESMNGPFWPVPPQQYVGGGQSSPPLGGLLVALMAPHPLPFTHVAWDKASLRRWEVSEFGEAKWTETRLFDAEWTELVLSGAIDDPKLAPGTILVLPPAEKPLTPPPAALLEALKRSLSFHWQLAIGQQPEITSHYAPRFFHREQKQDGMVWQDIDPSGPERPLLPVAIDLLFAHPRAAEYLPTSSPWWPGDQWPAVLKGAEGMNDLGKLNLGAPEWLPPGAKISVTPAPKPRTGQVPSAPGPSGPAPPSKRTSSPTQGQ